MKPEDRFLFLAARQKLQPDHVQRMEALSASPRFNWDLVFSTAEYNGIAPLVYKHVTDLPVLAQRVPKKLLNHYRLYTVNNILVKKERAQLLCQTLQFLHDRNIQVIVLKGTAQDLLVYSEPWITVSGDIDLLLSSKRESLPERTVQHIYHQLHKKHIEFDFFEHHDLTMNGLLMIDFDALRDGVRQVDCYGEPGLVLSAEDHLLSLCINSCRKRFFRLKSILDIYEAILRGDQFDWQRFAERSRQFKCEKIVYTALLVTNLAIGRTVPADVMRNLGVSAGRAVIIQAAAWYLIRFVRTSSSNTSWWSRFVDLSLVLPYLSYNPDQLSHKLRQMRDRQHSDKENITAHPTQ